MASSRLKTRFGTLLESIGLPDARVSLLFVGDRAMRTLNRRYRGKDRTTDVLSFSFREGSFSHIQPDFLGDIVISVPAAVRQAVQAGHSVSREIDILLVHGLVHLLGYDHEISERQAARMKRREQEFLKRLSA